jgi:hypothetical protein
MKKLLLVLTLLFGALPLIAQTTPPAPSTGHWIIVDTTYEVGTTTTGTTQADLYFVNNTAQKITGMQFRVFYDKVAFAGASPTVALLYNSSNQYMQYVTDQTNGHITVTMVYTGSSTTFDYSDSAAVKLTFTHAAPAVWNNLASIDSLKVTGAQVFNNLAATNFGNDTTLSMHSYGGEFIQKSLSFAGAFLTTGGDGAEDVWLSLEKKPKTGSTWSFVNQYSTDSLGHFAFTEILDTTYWDTRIKIQGDTLGYGNIISTADAQKINQSVLGQYTPVGFDFYTMDINGTNSISISDAYSVFSRIAGGMTAWPNSVPELLFFTETEYNAIVNATTSQASTYPGNTNFTYYINGGPDSVTYYVAVKGDANATGFNMARLTPIEIINPDNASQYIIDQTVDYKNQKQEMEVRMPDLEVKAGNFVEVPVTVLTDGQNIGALQLNINYDETLLKFHNVINSEKVMNWLSYFDPSNGRVEWGGADFSNKNLLNNGETAFTLQFSALQPQQDWSTSPLWVAEKYVGDQNSSDMDILPTMGRVAIYKVQQLPVDLSGFEIVAFPNPTNQFTTLQFNILEEGPVEVSIFDVTGRKLIQLIKEENMPAGQFIYDVDLSVLSSGYYYSSVLTQDGVATAKVVVIK